MTLDTLVTIAKFKHHLQAAGYAPATIESYRANLNCFAYYLEKRRIEDLRKVTAKVLSDYKAHVTAQPIATETKALKLRPVKRLFEHLAAANRLLINPCEGLVETCRVNRKLGPVLTEAETRRLLAQPDTGLRLGIRDRAILQVLYATAIRIGELITLNVYDADLKEQVLFIRNPKNNCQRMAPLGKKAAQCLTEYLDHIRPHYARKKPRQRALFLINTGDRLNANAVRTMIKKYGIGAGIQRSVSPHMLRRSCATHMLRSGADIRHVQKLLGHHCIKSTQVYTHVAAADIKQTHNTTHPGKTLCT
jgi:integrase/recombinase XerD